MGALGAGGGGRPPCLSLFRRGGGEWGFPYPSSPPSPSPFSIRLFGGRFFSKISPGPPRVVWCVFLGDRAAGGGFFFCFSRRATGSPRMGSTNNRPDRRSNTCGHNAGKHNSAARNRRSGSSTRGPSCIRTDADARCSPNCRSCTASNHKAPLDTAAHTPIPCNDRTHSSCRQGNSSRSCRRDHTIRHTRRNSLPAAARASSSSHEARLTTSPRCHTNRQQAWPQFGPIVRQPPQPNNASASTRNVRFIFPP